MNTFDIIFMIGYGTFLILFTAALLYSIYKSERDFREHIAWLERMSLEQRERDRERYKDYPRV